MQSDGTRAEIMFMDELMYKKFIKIVVWSRMRSKRNEAANRTQRFWRAWHTAWKQRSFYYGTVNRFLVGAKIQTHNLGLQVQRSIH